MFLSVPSTWHAVSGTKMTKDMNKREVLLNEFLPQTPHLYRNLKAFSTFNEQIELSDLVRVLGCQQWKLTPAYQSRII